MMTAEFMLSKRPVLRFTAALFFLLKLLGLSLVSEMAITLGFVTIRSISSCILVLFLERLLTLKWMRKKSFFNRLAVKLDKFEGEKYSSLLLTMQEKLILHLHVIQSNASKLIKLY